MGTPARNRAAFLTVLAVLASASAVRAQRKFPPPPKAPKRPAISARLLAAKSVYFDNETGDSAVGRDTLRELNQWGRFRLVGQDQAQLLLVLSTEEFTDDDFPPDIGDFDPNTLHLPRKPLNAFLTVIDRTTGDRLWIDSRPWGGLLTGANSAGRRLIAKLRKRVERQPPPS